MNTVTMASTSESISEIAGQAEDNCLENLDSNDAKSSPTTFDRENMNQVAVVQPFFCNAPIVPNSFSMDELLASAQDREYRLSTGGELKVRAKEETGDYRSQFIDICIEAANVGRLTRLQECVVEAIAPEKPSKPAWKASCLLSIENYRSKHIEVAQEAAYIGNTTKLPEIIVSNSDHEKENPKSKISFYLDPRKSLTINDIKLPVPTTPKIGTRDSARGSHDLSEIIEKALERQHRLSQAESRVNMKTRCNCAYCPTASPLQTFVYRELERKTHGWKDKTGPEQAAKSESGDIDHASTVVKTEKGNTYDHDSIWETGINSCVGHDNVDVECPTALSTNCSSSSDETSKSAYELRKTRRTMIGWTVCCIVWVLIGVTVATLSTTLRNKDNLGSTLQLSSSLASPTLSPTPLVSPSTVAPTTGFVSSSPTDSPTMSKIICSDNPAFIFRLSPHDQTYKTCAWLAENLNEQYPLCSGKLFIQNCRKACDYC